MNNYVGFTGSRPYYHKDVDIKPNFEPAVISGADIYEMLCPVSDLTGHRNNPLDCLGMVTDPAKARLIDAVLKEQPYSGAPSDDGTFETLASRLDLGTDAERTYYINALQKVADSLNVLSKPKVADVKDNIQFDKSDSNNGAE